MVPVGLVFRTFDPAAVPPVALAKAALDGEDDPRVPKDYLTSNLIGHFHYMLGATSEASTGPEPGGSSEAQAAPAQRRPVLQPGPHLRRNGLYDEALAAFDRSNEINPRPIPGGSKAKAFDHLGALETERRRVMALEAELLPDPHVVAAAPGSREWHQRLAVMLRARGEVVAARGHELRALETS